MRNREYVTDARGFMSELLAKGLAAHKIDAPLDAADIDRLIAFLRTYGDLDENHIYHGSSRAGYLNAGMVEPPQHKGVLDFSELLKSSFWRSNMHFAESVDQTPMMMEPVGGMDKVVDAFIAKVGSRVRIGAQVQSVMLRDDVSRSCTANTASASRCPPTTASTAFRCTCSPVFRTTFLPTTAALSRRSAAASC